MSDTIRETIIKNFLTRAATIVPTTYQTSIGSHVLRARQNVDPGELPCCVVWPQPEEAENIAGQSMRRMGITIEGIAVFGTIDQSVFSELILGDLYKCFTAQNWTRSPNYIESIIYQGGGTSQYPEDGQSTIGVSALFIVSYYTKLGDPFSQD